MIFFLSIPFEKNITPPSLHDVAILSKILILSVIFDRETKITFLCEKILARNVDFYSIAAKSIQYVITKKSFERNARILSKSPVMISPRLVEFSLNLCSENF